MTPLVASVPVLGALIQVLPTRWFAALEGRYEAGSLALKVALPFAAIFLISVAAPSGIAPFIYFQF
jgi:alginate O-acetyltransferase complex protein AlgI